MATLKPHVIIAASPGPYGLCGARLAYKAGIPFLTGFHTSFEHLTALYWPDSLRGRLIGKYFLYCNRYLFRHTAVVLGNSESILQQARAMGATQTRLVGTPLAPDFLTPPIPWQGKLEKLIFAGRLAKEKNIDAILAAAQALPDVVFDIAGDGPLRELVINASTSLPNLHYLGWLSRDRLSAAIDAHDALLLPSHYETFGTIALEAMARQRLAIVAPGCGISQWQQLRPGLCVIQDDETLLDTLRRLRAIDDSQRLAIARQAHTLTLQLNTGVTAQWCALLQEFSADTTPVTQSD